MKLCVDRGCTFRRPMMSPDTELLRVSRARPAGYPVNPGLFILFLVITLLALAHPAAAWSRVLQTSPSEKGDIVVTEVLTGLDHPWSIAFLPDDAGALITERPGRLRLWEGGAALSEPIEGVPAVYAHSQGGLLEVALPPDFSRSRRVYLSYAEADEAGKAGTTVGHGVLSADGRKLEDFTVIFRQEPKLSTGQHFGSRLVFDHQGDLFIALGENNQRATAQDLDKLQGKVVRLHADGRIPDDNPFVDDEHARPEIWSYGHRNQQGAAINPWTRVLWT